MNLTQGDRRDYKNAWSRITYLERKTAMINALGAKCEQCGATDDLQFNHIQERFWTPRRVNCLTRLKIYQAEIDQGKINLLCRACNAVYEPEPAPAEYCPF